jgi:hypothetical protein
MQEVREVLAGENPGTLEPGGVVALTPVCAWKP